MEDGSLQELPTDNPGRPCREDPGVGTSLDQSVPCAEVRGVSIARVHGLHTTVHTLGTRLSERHIVRQGGVLCINTV